MFARDQYELLDFGEGRKLERFGPHVLDRPAPAADADPRQHPDRWRGVAARYERSRGGRGQWQATTRFTPWTVACGTLRFELRLSPTGQLGLFPEQAVNWDWITRQVRQRGGGLKVLNLFAYTGGSSLAAAAAGAEVVHIDAARNVVDWAQQNARLSNLEGAPIRWIAEDVRKFVDRELRRGHRYDAVILDPPAYGHGPRGQAWKIQQHLMPLLAACAELTRRQPAFMLLTCHTVGYGPAVLQATLADAVFGHCQSGVVARPLWLTTSEGRRMSAGTVARWPAR